MEVIKSVKDLPEWFKEKKYEKNLDAVDWYREIRRRQYGLDVIEFIRGNPNATGHHPRDAFNIFCKPLAKDWVLYHIPQRHYPVEDMSRREALYLAACLDEDEASKKEIELHRLILKMYKNEMLEEDRTVFSHPYEKALEAYFDHLSKENEENDHLDGMVMDEVNKIGNPYLSYSRPIKGHPVIIDTTFDDETILEYVRRWLQERRAESGEKARRPFRQDDFDDWAYYRIREVVDLDTWAQVNDVKILDKVIAAALWPNAPDDISPIDVLRTTTRRKVREVFQMEVCARFYSQLMLERGGNFLDE